MVDEKRDPKDDERLPDDTTPEPLTITSIKPDTMPLNEPDFTIRVFGTGFTSNTMIVFNRDNRPTEFTPPNRVTANIESHMITHAATYPVTVKDGIAESNEIDFTYTPALTADEKAARAKAEAAEREPTPKVSSRPTVPPPPPQRGPSVGAGQSQQSQRQREPETPKSRR